jgi:broad specificity phosphatase PhoE
MRLGLRHFTTARIQLTGSRCVMPASIRIIGHAPFNRRRLAKGMRSVLARETFKLVLCSPMQWARETRELAGLGDKAVIHLDLVEWNHDHTRV